MAQKKKAAAKNVTSADVGRRMKAAGEQLAASDPPILADLCDKLEAAMKSAGFKAKVDAFGIDDDCLTYRAGGVYDYIQRQGRSDEDLIAAAVAAFPRHGGE